MIEILFQFISACMCIAFYYIFIRPPRQSFARRLSQSDKLMRSVPGCVECGTRLFPTEPINYCIYCEHPFSFCDSCLAVCGHRHATVRELVPFAVDAHSLKQHSSVPTKMLAAFALYADRPFLGELVDGRYSFQAFRAVLAKSERFGRVMTQTGLLAGDVVFLFAKPSVAWFVCQYACFLFGFLVVPIHFSHKASTLDAMIAKAKPAMIFVDRETVKCVSAAVAGETVALESFAQQARLLDAPRAHKALAHVVAQLGDGDESRMMMLLPSSGSTSTPKLTIMTDGMLRSQMTPPTRHVEHVLLAHQPLNQSLDMIAKGGAIGICSAGLQSIESDSLLLRPTAFGAVPAFWSGLQARYQEKLSELGGDRAKALQWFKRQRFLGNRLKIIIVSGAASSQELRDFLWEAFGCTVIDGFGSTELGSMSSNGSVLKGSSLMLIDNKEHGLFTADGVGEIVASSGRLTPGYFGDAEKTRQTFVEIGGTRYMRTGDIGRLDSDGNIAVIGRVSSQFKLSSGEFVHVETLEQLFGSSALVRNVFVGPDARNARIALLVQSSGAKEELLSDLLAIARENNLKAHETPLASTVFASSEPWTTENQMLTSVGKLNRAELSRKLKAIAVGDNERAEQVDAAESAISSGMMSLLRSNIATLQTVSRECTLVEIGADSLAIARLSSQLRSQHNTTVGPRLLAKLTVADIEAVVFGNLSVSEAAKRVQIDFEAIVERCVNSAMHEPTVQTASAKKTSILLTGANGFLGVHILRQLLRLDANRRVVCLVRSEQRLRDATRFYRLEQDIDWQRVSIVIGDLADASKLALESDVWQNLVRTVHVVLHNGARVNGSADLKTLQAVNVVGSAWVARLAREASARLIYVSSIAALAGAKSEQMHAPSAALQAASGYAQSKWCAERVCRAIASDTIVVRVGTITGNEHGCIQTQDSVAAICMGLIKLGAVCVAPDSPLPKTFSLIAVDQCANVFARLCAPLDSAGASRVFHLLGGEQNSLADWLDAIEHDGATRLKRVSAATFRAMVDAIQDDSHPLFRFKAALTMQTASPVVRDDALPTCTALSSLLDVQFKRISPKRLQKIAQFLIATVRSEKKKMEK